MDFTMVVKKNEGTVATSVNRHESHKQNIEWKRQVTEEYIKNDAMYIKLKNSQNQIISCLWTHTCGVKVY